MKNTAAFLVLLWCLTGSALGETQSTTQQQGCSSSTQGTTTTQGDPSAPQNQIEYGGGG